MSLGNLMAMMGSGSAMSAVPPGPVQTSMAVLSFLDSVRTGPTQCPHTDGDDWKEKHGGRELTKTEQRLYDAALETIRLYITGEKCFGLPDIFRAPPDTPSGDGPNVPDLEPVH